MRRSRAVACGSLLVAGLLAVTDVLAQQGPTIDQRLQMLQQVPATEPSLDERIRTGKEDLLLLRRRKLFTAYATTSLQYTDNAFLSNKNRKEDLIYAGAVGVRAATRIAQTYDIFADVALLGARYEDNASLGYNSLRFTVGGSAPVEDWILVGTYVPSIVYDRRFDDHQVTLHDLTASARRTWYLDARTAVTPVLSVTLTLSDPEDYERLSASLGARLSHVPAGGFAIVITPQVFVRDYFDYFEGFFGERRQDVGVSLSASGQWRPHENIIVSTTLALTASDSTLPSQAYDAVTVTPTIEARIRF